MLIYNLACCARRLLSVQPDFQSQKYEIEEFITSSAYRKHHLVIYYPKYHYELNHIDHFGVVPKSGQGKTVNIPLKIFDVVFFVLWLVCLIRLFWHITIVVNENGPLSGRAFLWIILLEGSYIIIKLQIKMRIDKGALKGLLYDFMWLTLSFYG